MNVGLFFRKMLITRKYILCLEPISYDLKEPFCEDCESEWDDFLEVRCNRCGSDRFSCTCLPAMVRKNFHDVCWSVFYNPKSDRPSDLLVYKLKYQRNREIINFCAMLMKKSLERYCHKHSINYREFAITYVPRRRWNRQLYMLDQSKELAKQLSLLLGIEFVDSMINKGKTDQKKLSAIERRRNAQGAYVLKKNFENKYKKYFLVDDIITTGSTLVFCSRLLHEAGATDVIPVTYAKDNYKTKGDY